MNLEAVTEMGSGGQYCFSKREPVLGKEIEDSPIFRQSDNPFYLFLYRKICGIYDNGIWRLS